ncbi:DsbA family oxidoreductase [Nemorincola caseinilytica]
MRTSIIATFAVWLLIIPLCTNGRQKLNKKTITTEKGKTMTTGTKMKVEIWSDIMCPFCYIGKRHFEEAMGKFADSGYVEIVWKSFQLDPSIPDHIEPRTDVYTYLATRKGLSVDESKRMHERVVQMASAAGLQYNFDKAVVANSWRAHRLIQMAKTKGLGDAAEERLFRAYFTEGQDMGDTVTLTALGKEIGLTETDVKEALTNDVYTHKIEQDIKEAEAIGVNGVPFFVFDRKYAVSGAQPADAFVRTLERAVAEWKKANPAAALQIEQGAVCKPGGECE